ncbi:XRE family transcriptional regulator, partial [Salmonella enterica subsp. enterica serovar Poona]
MTKKVNLSTTAGADVSTINEAVSQRIKQFRSQKKMSLDELARRSGVSKGMLVEIEGCKANPSIALLCKIAAAMGVSVADFVNVASEPMVQLIAREASPLLRRGAPAVSSHLIART